MVSILTAADLALMRYRRRHQQMCVSEADNITFSPTQVLGRLGLGGLLHGMGVLVAGEGAGI